MTSDADYVCPQCGPDPRGGEIHTEEQHVWPIGPKRPMPYWTADDDVIGQLVPVVAEAAAIPEWRATLAVVAAMRKLDDLADESLNNLAIAGEE